MRYQLRNRDVIWATPDRGVAEERAAVHSTYDARPPGKVIGPAGRFPDWPDVAISLRPDHPTAMI
jgi:hypothetical protein